MVETDARSTRRETVLLSLGVVITSVWTLAVVVQIVDPSRSVPTEVHGIMFLVATFFFGGAAREAWKATRDA